MTEFEYAALINDGLYDPSPRESVFRVKNAVLQELQALDPTADVHRTDYFNHTFAPDFVLSWPDQIERHVYLRFTYDMRSIAEDLRLIDRRNPLVFGLTPPENDREGMDAVGEAASNKDAMFTDSNALENLINRKKTSTTVNMLNNALAQGGRGLLIGERTTELARTIDEGFTGAENVRLEPTSDAVNAIDSNLEAPQAWRMNRVLQAVWEGSSGGLETFPGKPDLSGSLNVDALQYLLTYMETDDLTFWRRVGRSLQISQIEALKAEANDRNLHRLITANLDVIRARAYALVEDPLGVNSLEEEQEFRWAVRGRRLTFSGPNFFSIIGETKAELNHESSENSSGIDVPDFVERSSGTKLIEVTIHSGRDVITARNEDGALDKDRLLGLSSQLGPGAEILEAVVQSETGRVTVDFQNGTGTGQTRSNIRLADLLLSSMPLLHEFGDDLGMEGLRDSLSYIDPGSTDVLPIFTDSNPPDDESSPLTPNPSAEG